MKNNTDTNCVFCKIVADEIPSYKVYEDENILAFLTNDPINEGHTLVIPKNHVPNWIELSELENKNLFFVAQKVANKIKSVLQPKTVGVIIAGWDVSHTHIHLVPMHEYNDITSEKILNKTMPNFSPEDKEKTLAKIKF